MAMKESPRSLTAYFIVIGLWTGWTAIGPLSAGNSNVLAMALLIIQAAWALAFVVTGVLTTTLLRRAPIVLHIVVVGTTAWTLLLYGLRFIAGAGTILDAAGAALTVAIGIYLVVNVRRLSQAAPAPDGQQATVGQERKA